MAAGHRFKSPEWQYNISAHHIVRGNFAIFICIKATGSNPLIGSIIFPSVCPSGRPFFLDYCICIHFQFGGAACRDIYISSTNIEVYQSTKKHLAIYMTDNTEKYNHWIIIINCLLKNYGYHSMNFQPIQPLNGNYASIQSYARCIL